MKTALWAAGAFMIGAAAGFSTAWTAKGMVKREMEAAEAGSLTGMQKKRGDHPIVRRKREVEDAVAKAHDPVAPEKIAEMKAEIAALSDAEFGEQMSAAWSTKHPRTPEALMRRALFLAACDGNRAMEFYAAFKGRKGMSLQREGGQELRAVMTQLGMTDGKRFMENLLAFAPEGTSDIDSLMHGWAKGNLDEAVAWMNALPEGSPVFSKAVKGLIWSLGEVSPESAISVFNGLADSERDARAYHSLSSSVVQSQGIEGLAQLAALATDKVQKDKIFMHGMEYANYKPPRTFVRDMAVHLESYPQVRGDFSKMSARWIAVEPGEAFEWFRESADEGKSPAAIALMSAQLSKGGKHEEVDAWLKENSSSPGYAAVKAGRESDER